MMFVLTSVTNESKSDEFLPPFTTVYSSSYLFVCSSTAKWRSGTFDPVSAHLRPFSPVSLRHHSKLAKCIATFSNFQVPPSGLFKTQNDATEPRAIIIGDNCFDYLNKQQKQVLCLCVKSSPRIVRLGSSSAINSAQTKTAPTHRKFKVDRLYQVDCNLSDQLVVLF